MADDAYEASQITWVQSHCICEWLAADHLTSHLQLTKWVIGVGFFSM